MKKHKVKSKVIVIFVTLILSAIVIFVGKEFLKEPVKEKEDPVEKVEIPKPKLKIIDLESKTRPIGVMIDNVNGAWPQAGLEEAYIIYDITVEWGLTRLFAIFKDSVADNIGPVRSARHYFLDYALENDALYVHHGWSPQAQRDIPKFGINTVVPVNRKGTWGQISPHNVFTSIEEINKLGKNIRNTTEKENLFNYSVEALSLEKQEGAVVANKVNIKYSGGYNVRYEYDSENNIYKRFINGKTHVDAESKNQLTAKNIIVINVKGYPDPYNSDSGRITIDNVGTGTGFFITNGFSRPITWEKTSRTEQTVYKYLDGKEITLNDGNVYIQIQPLDQKATFE